MLDSQETKHVLKILLSRSVLYLAKINDKNSIDEIIAEKN